MSEKNETFLKCFKQAGIESQNWPCIFEILTQQENGKIKETEVEIDIDLRAIFAVLDKYIEHRIKSDKVVEGILKDIAAQQELAAVCLRNISTNGLDINLGLR